MTTENHPVENGICQHCARDYRDNDPKYHIETGPCPSYYCPSNGQNKSPPCHTAGPWQYSCENGLVSSFDIVICAGYIDPDSPKISERHANGYLIEAAPDLLEGSEHAVAAFDSLISLLPDRFCAPYVLRLSNAIEALRDAIA